MERIVYETFTNLSRDKYFDGYKSGDELVFGYRGAVEGMAVEPDLLSVCHFVFSIHNRDDRPDGAWAPSLSVGDLVAVVGEKDERRWFSVDRMGFSEIEGGPPYPLTGVERQKLWTEVDK